MKWHHRKNLLAQNDGASLCPKTNKVVVSDLLARMIAKSTFKNRYYTTFTYPRTKTITGSDIDKHVLIGQFINFLRKFSQRFDTHLLPIFGCEPEGSDERFHIHAIILSEKAINRFDWDTAVSMSSQNKISIKEHRKASRKQYQAEATSKELRLSRKLTPAEELKMEEAYDQSDEDYQIYVKAFNKMSMGNGQQTKHFEVYEERNGANLIGYIFGKHRQETAFIFCPGGCEKGKCSHRVPFAGLTSEMKNTRLFQSLS